MRPSLATATLLNFKARGAVCLLFLFCLAASLRASDYSRDVGGNFDDPVWTRGFYLDPDFARDVGPPGSGDTGGMGGTDAVTATGGDVKALSSSVDFIVNGAFHAGSFVSTATLQGSGVLTLDSVDSGFTIKGGNVVTAATTDSMTVNGGTFHTGTLQAYSLAVGSNGQVKIDSPVTNLNLDITGGGGVTLPGLSNGRSTNFTLLGTGSTVTMSGTLSIKAGALDVEYGALNIAGDLALDGGQDVDGDPIGGGGLMSGAGTAVSVGGTTTVGNAAAAPGFSLTIKDGAVITSSQVQIGSQSGSKGTVAMSGTGTIWHAAGGFTIGLDGNGELDLSADAQLQMGSGTGLAVGFDQGGRGALNAEGINTVIDASQALLSVGKGAGSFGNVTLDFGGVLVMGQDTFIGDAGNGSFNVQGGSRASLDSSGTVVHFGVGNAATGSGSVSVEGTGSLFIMGDGTETIVGVAGYGFFGAGNGATVQSARLAVGTAPGATGQIVIDGAGTTWTNTRQMGVGGNPVAAEQGPGSVTVQNSAQLRVGASPPDVLFIARTGQVILDGTGQIAVGAGAFGGGGTLRVSAPGRLRGKGRQSGTTVYNTNVTGNVIIGNGGRFQPGADPDVFSVQGDVDLSDGGAGGGETDFEIGGAGTAGVDYDQLVASGTVTLGGTLRLIPAPGYTPTVGDKLNLIKGGSVAGSFAQVVAPGLTVSPVAGSGGLSVTVTSVTPTAAPTVTSAMEATAAIGQAFSYQITGSNSPAGYAATTLPDGLDFDPATGEITGVPTTAGTTSVTISATNFGGTGTATLALTVGNAVATGAPVITSLAMATGTPGAAFSYQITATNTPTSFAATGLPDGLTLDAGSGLISGTPTGAGTFSIALGATNAAGTGTAALTLTIAPTLPTVTLSAAIPSVTAGSGQFGEFLLTLDQAATVDLHVNLEIKGTAVNGQDYMLLKTSKKIKAGKTQKAVKVKPQGDLGGVKKTVKLTLAPGDGYTVGTTDKAKVKILPAAQ